jgi:SAM-dependent methyltransferase
METARVPGVLKDRSKTASYVLCDPSRHARSCGLLQAQSLETAPAPCASARHSSNREHLRALATEALELLSGRDCSALDIGCNDGSLLSYYPRWVERFGVDPSAHVDEVGKWAWSAKAAFPSPELDAAFGEKKFDIITAASVFEHIDDPRRFLAAVKSRLTDDGVFAMETLYAPMVLTRNSIDVFQAGVAAVYSLSVLEWLVRSEGMKVVKGALTAKQGGSIRLFITHKENAEFDFDPWSERLARLWDEENALAMRALQPYQSFEQRAADIRHRLSVMFGEIAGRNESVHILGADPQTEALLAFMGPAAKIITAVVDTHAAREVDTLGATGLPVISDTESRAAEPDYVLAPARFKREMLERWREAIMLGAKMIFATPEPHIVTAANYAGEFGKTIAAGDTAGGSETLRSILAAAGAPRLIAENKDAAKTA